MPTDEQVRVFKSFLDELRYDEATEYAAMIRTDEMLNYWASKRIKLNMTVDFITMIRRAFEKVNTSTTAEQFLKICQDELLAMK